MSQYTFFWKSHSPFSQWYLCNFVVDGIEFNCAEQYMMYKKAELFSDLETAKKILESTSPAKQKKLGRQVKGFDQQIWDQHCKQIVYEGNYAKFTQNPDLKEELLKTKGTILVEASPVDRIWGVGLSEEDPRILNPKEWRGRNYLGEILTKLREDLMKSENL